MESKWQPYTYADKPTCCQDFWNGFVSLVALVPFAVFHCCLLTNGRHTAYRENIKCYYTWNMAFAIMKQLCEPPKECFIWCCKWHCDNVMKIAHFLSVAAFSFCVCRCCCCCYFIFCRDSLNHLVTVCIHVMWGDRSPQQQQQRQKIPSGFSVHRKSTNPFWLFAATAAPHSAKQCWRLA